MKRISHIVTLLVIMGFSTPVLSADLYISPDSHCQGADKLVEAVFGTASNGQKIEQTSFKRFATDSDTPRTWVMPLKEFNLSQLYQLPDSTYHGLQLLLLAEPGGDTSVNYWSRRVVTASANNKGVVIAIAPCEMSKGYWPKISQIVRKVTGLSNTPLVPGIDLSIELGLDGHQISHINQRVMQAYNKSDKKAEFTRPTEMMAYLATVPDKVKLRAAPKMGGVQKVFYATNRKPSGVTAPDEFFGGERDLETEIHYGIAKVTFPRNHKRFKIENPLFSISWLKDTEAHVSVRNIKPVKSDVFFNKLAQHVQPGGDPWRNSMIVYIHGFNVSFHSALQRVAQLTYDFEYPGAPVLFSWPSDGELTSYMADREDANWSAYHLSELLIRIKQSNPERPLHLIAHSMGNQVLMGALQRLRLLYPEDKAWFETVVMAAPDYDAHLFNYQVAEKTVSFARRWAVYVSENDMALQASQKLNATPRLGMPMYLAKGVEFVDASKLDVNLWSVPDTHSYYATQLPVVEDIAALLKGKPPQQRKLIAQEYKGQQFWLLLNNTND